jgi:hypothetical protein
MANDSNVSSLASPLNVGLSGRGLRNVKRSFYENDFTFMIGAARYDCPLFIAEFISPKVARILSIDPTIREFYVEEEDPLHEFATILNLGSGCCARITESNSNVLKSLRCKLWNRELFDLISRHFEGDLSCENVIPRLQFLSEAQEDYEVELDFICSHFSEMLKSGLNNLNASLIHELICRPSLRLLTEDSLWNFIHTSFCNDSLFSSLLECVKFDIFQLNQ